MAEVVTGFLLLGSKITADDDCSHEIRRRLLLSKKAMTNLDHCWKADITLLTKVSIIKVMVLDPVVTYYCESGNVKKVKGQRIDAFELWCWRRLRRVPLTAGRPNHSILREINPEYSLEGLKLQYFGHLIPIANSLDWCWNWSSSILVIWCR